MKSILFVCLIYCILQSCPLLAVADTIPPKPLIAQTITYFTGKAGEMYLVWGTNGWKIPDKKFIGNSFIERDMVWSKMEKKNDSFSILLNLPEKTELQFMFWAPVDSEGDSTDGWDTYGSQIYTSIFNENKNMKFNDQALWMPSKQQFDILRNGLEFLCISLIISASLLIAFYKRLRFSPGSLLIGALFSSTILVMIIRLQMTGLINKNQLGVFGAGFPDLVWYFSIALITGVLILTFKNRQIFRTVLSITACIIILASVLFSLINIDIVKFLGRPLNYQWLYYSNFMEGADVQSALSKNLSNRLILNLSLLLLSVITFQLTYAFLPKSFYAKTNKFICILLSALLVFGFYQYRTINYDPGKIANPAWELVSSTVISERSSKLFTMRIPDTTKTFIENYHSQTVKGNIDTSSTINNIIVFVLESTPAHMLGLYDSTYNVTPNINRYKQISRIYTNMYSHLPATVYSMASILAGVYPMLSYKSIIAEYPKNSLPTITSELKKKGWVSSLLFSADLGYSNMGIYAKNQGFDLVEDNTSMPCAYKKFGETNTFLDQLDDRCLVDRYFQWADLSEAKNKFSMLWTTQTHYEYYFRDKEIEFVKGNPGLNRYLNALQEVDQAFGNLMVGLEKRSVLKNTLVILTADHGEAFGTHDQINHGSKIYNENIHVPFVLINPVRFKGEISDAVSGHIDIAPTLSSLCSFEKPKEWQGKNLFEINSNNARTFFVCPFSDFLFGTRSKNWKYIYNATIDKGELYDLDKDPWELKNVSKDHPEIVNQEFEMLAGWVQYHSKRIKQLLK